MRHPLRPVLALLAATLLALPAGAAAKPKSKLSVVVPAGDHVVGERIAFTGTIKPAAKRSLRLELRGPKRRWTLVVSGSSTTKGTFTLRGRMPRTAGTVTLRVRAPHKVASRTLTSKAFTVTLSPGVQIDPSTLQPLPTKTPVPKATPTPQPTPTPVPTPAPKSSFRVLYALASDQTAKPGQVAAIRATIDAVDGWYATQTTGNVRPRWVREPGGAVAVSTITLANTAAELGAAGFIDVVGKIQAVSPQPANQRALVFLDTTNSSGCGVTGAGTSIVFEAACGIHPASPTSWPFDATYLTAHELTHNFGAVSSCAPHAGNGGHVTDDPKDILYSGPLARDWANITLDPGHDDYYATGRSDCPGITASPFWTATSDPLS